MDTMNITIPKSEFTSEKIPKKDIPILYRFQNRQNRFYFSVEKDITIYPSATTVISNTTPLSFGLKKLIAELGLKGFYEMMREKAEYGTILHIMFADFLKNQYFEKLTFDKLLSYTFKTENQWNPKKIEANIYQLNKDMLTFITFCRDFEVEPLLIEFVGGYIDPNNPEIRVAGASDLVCEMTIEEKGFWGEEYKSGVKKGQPKETKQRKRITALIDLKSGKSGFFEDYEIQLGIYKMIIEQNFELKIDKMYNLAPRDYRTAPTYALKDQTDSKNLAKIPHLLSIFNIDDYYPKDIKIISEKVDMNNIDNAFQIIKIKEFLKNKYGGKNGLPK